MSLYNSNGTIATILYNSSGKEIAVGETDRFINGRLVLFEDDFNKGYLDSNNWIAENRGNFANGAIQYYTSRPSNVRVEDSNLILSANRESYKGKEWTSAQVISRGLQEFKYGRIEAKIKMPTAQGLWPAFWTLGRWYGSDSVRQWPACGEIDIMEHLNNDATYHTVLHYNTEGNTIDLSQGGANVVSANFSEYNIFGVEWAESGFDFYLNDELVKHIDMPSGYEAAFNHAHSLLLSMQVGGWPGSPNDTTPDENLMYIDWVRVLAPEGVTERSYPTSIVMTQSADTVSAGETVDLRANVYPTNCTEQTISWKSENPFIASVKGGKVTGITDGDTTIYAVAKNGVCAKFNTKGHIST